MPWFLVRVGPLFAATLMISEYVAAQPPHPLNDTGFDWCADGGSNNLPCPVAGYPGQDGDYGRDVTDNDPNDGHAGFSFTKLDAEGDPLPADATEWSCVLDNVTGAVWEVKTTDGGLRDKDWTYSWYDSDSPDGEPGTEDGGACTTPGRCDTEKYVEDVNAQDLCGFSDWRMPTIKELAGITHLGRTRPSIDTDYFPSTVLKVFWSASPHVRGSSYAWLVDFNRGNDGHVFKSSSCPVRLVRSGQWPLSFVDNGDGTISDANTGRMWAQCSAGQSGADCGTGGADTMTWQAALSYAENATLAGYDDWRLPNRRELRSLFDYSTSGPAIDETYFPATPSDRFWSASPDAGDSYHAWFVHFGYGDGYYHAKTNYYTVRLVRDGQQLGHLPLNVSLSGNGSGTVTSTPSGIDCGIDCSQVYAPGTEITLTANADSGSELSAWSEPTCGTASTCTLNLDRAKNVTATFEPMDHPSPGSGLGLYNPATGTFLLKNSLSPGPADNRLRFGPTGPALLPLAGDWDNDGVAGIGLYNPAQGTFLFKNSLIPGTPDTNLPFAPPGAAAMLPLAGDWDNDGHDSIGLYNPASGGFLLKNSLTPGAADLRLRFGPAGSGRLLPLAGDWDGDGQDGLGLYNPNTGVFLLKNSLSPGAADITLRFAPPGTGWQPLAGDWDGDGQDSLGLHNPSSGVFLLKNSLSPGAADIRLRFAPPGTGWLPLSGHWGDAQAQRQALSRLLAEAEDLDAERIPQAPQPMPTAAALPTWLQDRLQRLAIDPEPIASGLLDADGHWLLFETPQRLVATDTNVSSDLYRLDLLSEQLSLISCTPAGQAGNGASRYPGADASGELIVFHSDADDLVPDDNNQVSDLFLHDLALAQTSRLTLSEYPSANPALDASGLSVLYDQGSELGNRQVFCKALAGGEAAQVLSLAQSPQGEPLDNHHPAISADGRFIAYLEQTRSEIGETPECQVHLYDRDTEVYHRQACPDALASEEASLRGVFSEDAQSLDWYLPGVAEPIRLSNPLSVETPAQDDTARCGSAAECR
ncbi:MAG: DUF1566 domain-containing protein [Chromatiaceae bacterium]|nr:DUF1566 domain-containing protein [Chromatiaceae bacterium]